MCGLGAPRGDKLVVLLLLCKESAEHDISGHTADAPGIITHPEITPDHMFEQSYRLSLGERRHHTRQDCTDSIKALVGLTYVL